MRTWFVEAIEQLVAREGSQSAAARLLKTNQANVNRWLSGEVKPTLDAAERVVSALGGDMRRALPGASMELDPEERAELLFLRHEYRQEMEARDRDRAAVVAAMKILGPVLNKEQRLDVRADLYQLTGS
jgi:DNA-binding transcriptional regulator YdaS (Cro superfamily)